MADEPAFPSARQVTVGEYVTGGHAGMTLRDYLAAAALTPIFNKIEGRGERMEVLQYVAEAAYQLADAMIVEREKRDGKD